MTSGDWLTNWGWDQRSQQPIAAYIHVPFCRHRCGYCNFSLLANREDLFERYCAAICTELSALRLPRSVQSIFLGGGTPSILPLALLRSLVKELQHWLPWDTSTENREFSIEANPLDITPEFCQQATSLGINRISIGGQSFCAEKLKSLERDHDPQELVQAIKIAQDHFPSVSLDLIFGAPGEILSDWRNDLEQAIQLEPHHISTYGLTYEKGARFWGMREKGQLQPASEDLELAMYSEAIEQLTQAGYEHYEVSNFATVGHQCRHNITYWDGRGWWAFGPSAARFVGRTRSVNHAGTLEYLKRVEAGRDPTNEYETLSDDQIVRERFVFGMRQLRGVDWPTIMALGPPQTTQAIETSVAEHIARGWMEKVGDRVRLTRAGLVLSDSLWSVYL